MAKTSGGRERPIIGAGHTTTAINSPKDEGEMEEGAVLGQIKVIIEGTHILFVFEKAPGKPSRSESKVYQDERKIGAVTSSCDVVALRPSLPLLESPLSRPLVIHTNNQNFCGLSVVWDQILPLDVSMAQRIGQFTIQQINGARGNKRENSLALKKLQGHYSKALQLMVTYISEEIENNRYDQRTFTIQDFLEICQMESHGRYLRNFESGKDYKLHAASTSFGGCFMGLLFGDCIANAYFQVGNRQTTEKGLKQPESVKCFLHNLKIKENQTPLTYTAISALVGGVAECLLEEEFFDPRKLAIKLMKRYYGEKKDRKYPRSVVRVFTKLSKSNCIDAFEPAREVFQSAGGEEPLANGLGEILMAPLACMFTATLFSDARISPGYFDRPTLVQQLMNIFHPRAHFLPHLYQAAISAVLVCGTRRKLLDSQHLHPDEYQGVVRALEQVTALIPEAFQYPETAVKLWTTFLAECKDQQRFSEKQHEVDPSIPPLFMGLACFLWAFSYEDSSITIQEVFERTLYLALLHGGNRAREVASIAGSFAGAYVGELGVSGLSSYCEDHENFFQLGHRLFQKFHNRPPLDLRITQGFPALTLTEAVSKIKALPTMLIAKDQNQKSAQEELANIVNTAVTIKECVDRAYKRVKIIGVKPAQQAGQFLQNFLQEVVKIDTLPVKTRSDGEGIFRLSKELLAESIQTIRNFCQMPDNLEPLDKLVQGKIPPLRSLTQTAAQITELMALTTKDDKICQTMNQLTTQIRQSTEIYRSIEVALAKVDRFEGGSPDEQFVQFLRNLTVGLSAVSGDYRKFGSICTQMI